MPPTAGQLRHTVTVQHLTKTTTETGGVVPTWSDLCARRANVTPIRMYQKLRNSEAVADCDHMVEMRYFPGLTETEHRLLYKGKILSITGIVDVGNRHFWYEIEAQTTTEGGGIG